MQLLHIFLWMQSDRLSAKFQQKLTQIEHSTNFGLHFLIFALLIPLWFFLSVTVSFFLFKETENPITFSRFSGKHSELPEPNSFC